MKPEAPDKRFARKRGSGCSEGLDRATLARRMVRPSLLRVSARAALRDNENIHPRTAKERSMIGLDRMRFGAEKGQTMIEYALLITLVSLLALGGLTLIADQVGPFFSQVGSRIGF
jgi:Flp pilus assembly pilin Flp